MANQLGMAEQHTILVLSRRGWSHRRIARSSKDLGVARRLWYVEGHAVDGHLSHPLAEGAAHAIHGEGTGDSKKELTHGTCPQACAGLRQSRLRRWMPTGDDQQQPPESTDDLSPNVWDVQIGTETDGNHQPDHRRS